MALQIVGNPIVRLLSRDVAGGDAGRFVSAAVEATTPDGLFTLTLRVQLGPGDVGDWEWRAICMAVDKRLQGLASDFGVTGEVGDPVDFIDETR